MIELDTLLAVDWLKLVIGPAVGACLAGIITLMVALVGPGTLRGWRLKKLVDGNRALTPCGGHGICG